LINTNQKDIFINMYLFTARKVCTVIVTAAVYLSHWADVRLFTDEKSNL